MKPLRMLALAMVLAILGQASAYQHKDKDKDKDAGKKKDPVRLKGYLPRNYKKLGLTDKQVQAIYKVQGGYKDRIEELQATIKKLKQEQDDKVEAVLTPEQLKRLKEIRSGDRK